MFTPSASRQSAVPHLLDAARFPCFATGIPVDDTIIDATCQLAIQSVPGMKNKLLGGEGLFNTVITGPGRVVLQTMPISTVANSIIPFIPTGK